jgi:putative flippase GtrA
MIKEFKKFISYFFVGGMAAIVEWLSFAIFNSFSNYNIATIIAFLLATIFNYYLGKYLTFKNCKQSKNDIISVFIVSGIGLVFNVILMNLFIRILKLKYQMIAKILSTGIVFIWNYISRRLFIYKEEIK